MLQYYSHHQERPAWIERLVLAADQFISASGVQLTWVDAKVDDWVVTPRIGKPIEINSLWYCALRSMAKFARQLDRPSPAYDAIADRTAIEFARFWNPALGYCYDVLDSPDGARFRHL